MHAIHQDSHMTILESLVCIKLLRPVESYTETEIEARPQKDCDLGSVVLLHLLIHERE